MVREACRLTKYGHRWYHLLPEVEPVNKVRHIVYLEKAQSAELEKLAAKTGAPVTELVRRAVAEYLKRSRS